MNVHVLNVFKLSFQSNVLVLQATGRSFKHHEHIYLDVFIAYMDVIRARCMLQNRDLEVKVGETYKGAEDGLSLYPWSLTKIS